MADVASFLSAVKSAPESVEPPSVSERLAAAEEVHAAESSPVASDLTKDITPSGIEVEYQSKPKRLYRVNGVEVPSVTTVLDVLRKDGLSWWGQGKAVQGVIDLFDIGALTTYFDWEADKERLAVAQGEDAIPADEQGVVDLLKHYKLTVNHRLDQASDRGVNVHDALEQWARHGEMPNPEEFPKEEKGYVEGLVKFLKDVDPTPIRMEVMVGSVEFGFAGRFDIDFETYRECEYTSRCYPKRADKRETLPPGLHRSDAKTSKGIYQSHHLQLAGYELAATEGGYPASDERRILRLDASGKYEFVQSNATAEQFLAVRSVYAALDGLK